MSVETDKNLKKMKFIWISSMENTKRRTIFLQHTSTMITFDNLCFDVDSTVIDEEGIDVLAAHNGAGEAVAEWTRK